MDDQRMIELHVDYANDLELLLHKLAKASRDDLLYLHEEGLNELAQVLCEQIEAALDDEREEV